MQPTGARTGWVESYGAAGEAVSQICLEPQTFDHCDEGNTVYSLSI